MIFAGLSSRADHGMSIASLNCWSTKTAIRRIVQGRCWLKNNQGVIPSPSKLGTTAVPFIIAAGPSAAVVGLADDATIGASSQSHSRDGEQSEASRSRSSTMTVTKPSLT
jgi:hypothetical protein